MREYDQNVKPYSKAVTDPVLSNISGYFRSQPSPASPRRHLMLAGICQDVFLKEWGSPEIEIDLDQIEGAKRGRLVVPLVLKEKLHSLVTRKRQDLFLRKVDITLQMGILKKNKYPQQRS
jgi:hypothetical protein